ncbi:MAG TPA: hypothetical protein VN581_07750 [Patescibacteria group bacterium]|nr:hypothetical protein [Patescibacteria group bacterium]
MRLRSIPARLVAVVVLLVVAGGAQAAMVGMNLVVRDPLGTGTFGGAGVGGLTLSASNVSGITLTAPITYRMTLPEGIRFVNGSSNSGSFVCTAPVTPRDVVCVRNTSWSTVNFSASLGFEVDIAANAPIGATEFTGTMENAQFPLPAPLNCVTTNGGTTQCTKDIVTVVQSQVLVDRIAIDSDNILTAGDDEVARVRVVNAGYDQGNAPVTMKLYWPDGVTFLSQIDWGGINWTCSGANPTTCTTNNWIVGSNEPIFNIRVANNIAIPGPLTIRTEIGNREPQPIPTDCLANPSQLGCFSASFATEPAPAPRLEITSMAHAAAVMPIQNNAGGITVSYRNIGDLGAGNFYVSLQLPPGFGYASLQAGTGYALTACTATGSVALGQTVKCSRSSGLPVNGSGSGIVRVNIERGIVSRQGSDALVIASIATASADTADPNILLDCASTPEATHCEHHAVPVDGRCMDYVEDIYCDGYETAP